MSTHIKVSKTFVDGSKVFYLLPKSTTRFSVSAADNGKVIVACESLSTYIDESIEEIEALLNG